MYRRILPIVLLAVLSLAGCATQRKTATSKLPHGGMPVGSIKTVRTTAYTQTEPGGSHSAIGTRLCDTNANGKLKSAASDWSRFPLGTKFQILTTGETYEICDYGSALVGKNTIDLYKSSRKAMRNWGARNVVIKIISWGSVEKSRKLLAPRSKYRHINTMLASLNNQG